MSNFIQYISVLILPILTTLTVVIAILFDGKLVAEGKKSLIRRIKPVAYLLIFITLSLNVYQAIDSNKTLADTKKQAKDKELKDSSRIAELQILAKTNLIKTDSVKIQLIDNAVKALEEQRLSIERERENSFIHFKSEVVENLYKILFKFEEKHIRGFSDTTLFIVTRLNNTYFRKYETISTRPEIIDYLMKTSELIEKVNSYANNIAETNDKKIRKMLINMFLANIEDLYNRLTAIYPRIQNLKSYKEYELTDFNKPFKRVNKQNLIDSLFINRIFESNDSEEIDKILIKK